MVHVGVFLDSFSEQNCLQSKWSGRESNDVNGASISVHVFHNSMVRLSDFSFPKYDVISAGEFTHLCDMWKSMGLLKERNYLTVKFANRDKFVITVASLIFEFVFSFLLKIWAFKGLLPSENQSSDLPC